MQGFFGGGLQPTQQSVLLDYFKPEDRGKAFGLSSIAIIVAPVLGLEKFPPALSLAITFALLATGVMWSLLKTRQAARAEA